MENEIYAKLVRYLATGRLPQEKGDEWTTRIFSTAKKNFEYDEGRLYKISDDHSLLQVIPARDKKETLSLAHDHQLSGHQGVDRTYYNLKQQVWWPGMLKDVQEYIRTCDKCQKRRTIKDQVARQPSETPQSPFEHIGIDVAGPLPITNKGNRYIVVAIDWLTKWVEAKPLKTANAQTIAEFIYEDVICRHGTPKEITSDRGTEFCNELLEQMHKTYHVRHIRTTAYHPQGNGLTERMNQTLKNTISKICDQYDNWDWYLSSALFAIRVTKQETTTFSPFDLVYGRIPRKEYGQGSPDFRESYENRVWSYVLRDITRLQRIRTKAERFIRKVQERTTVETKEATPLKIGDQVLHFRNIVESSWSAKLEPKWEGPYYVHKIKGTSVWLRKLSGPILPLPVHRTKIKAYHERQAEDHR